MARTVSDRPRPPIESVQWSHRFVPSIFPVVCPTLVNRNPHYAVTPHSDYLHPDRKWLQTDQYAILLRQASYFRTILSELFNPFGSQHANPSEVISVSVTLLIWYLL